MHLILAIVLIMLIGLVLWSVLKPPAPPGDNPRTKGDYEPMVRCHQCGVNLPQSQASRDNDGAWCCPAHHHENH